VKVVIAESRDCSLALTAVPTQAILAVTSAGVGLACEIGLVRAVGFSTEIPVVSANAETATNDISPIRPVATIISILFIR
jgi:ABC-type uncharacterized transport system permease subunit